MATMEEARGTDLKQIAPPAPHLLSAAVWRDAALVWLAQHVLIILFAIVGARGINPRLTPDQLLFNWTSWDASIYRGIAADGYRFLWQAAFYPLLPALERLLMTLTGASSAAASLIIANGAALGAFGLLRALVERDFGPAIARRSLLYLAVFPSAFFLLTGYSESLFLLCSVACFLALRRQRWLLAGVFAALAALTRPFGALLIVPILAEYVAARLPDWRASWRSDDRRRLALRDWLDVDLARLIGGVALPALAIAGFSLFLTSAFGPHTLLQAEASNWWERGFAPPWAGYQRAFAALLSATSPYIIAHIALDAAFTTLFIILTVALWRRLPAAYIAYAWATLALVLLTPSHGWLALGSNMRFMLVVFPLFMRLGQWGARPWVNALILGVSLLLLALLTTIFTIGGWVA